MSLLTKAIQNALAGVPVEREVSVADELADAELYDKVWDIFYAFCSAVYELDDREDQGGDPATPAEYAALIDEMASLLKQAYGATDASKSFSAVMRAIKDTHEQLVAAQQHRAAECGIAPKPGGHLTAPARFASHADNPADWADWTNFGYPIFDKAHADDAASRWGDDGNRAKYSAHEQSLISARIEQAQAKFGEGDTPKGVNDLDINKTQGEPTSVTPDESKADAPETPETETAPAVEETTPAAPEAPEAPEAPATEETPADEPAAEPSEAPSEEKSLETVIAKMDQLIEAIGRLTQASAPAPATPETPETEKNAEVDRLTAEREALRKEVEDLEAKAAEARARYDEATKQVLPSPLETAKELPVNEIETLDVTNAVDEGDSFITRSLSSFLTT